MRYWPLSTIAKSPLLHPIHQQELANFDRKMPSHDTYYACCVVKDQCIPLATPHLVIIESVGSPLRQMYVDYPTLPEWLGLERVGVVEGDNGAVFVMMNALH